MRKQIQTIAFDLDGTLTQHKTKLGVQNRNILDQLRQNYHLVMVGAGTCQRIWNQMDQYPIDIIGSYGMQFATYNKEQQTLDLQWDEQVPVDREEALRRAEKIRQQFGLSDFVGDTLEFHSTGALTFPVLGTKADLADKLAYDPDRSKRRIMYPRTVHTLRYVKSFPGVKKLSFFSEAMSTFSRKRIAGSPMNWVIP